ncbi:hypothetical protein [Halobacteriovorax sp. HLS]|uniref:hypothetical protein n=1 Tax=Halobacteriovorax sp. HLS TaxID=2234000 RepID=UPI000FD89ABD|nr:hypothetical protein [Halobacteriovorax sp. HLS]
MKIFLLLIIFLNSSSVLALSTVTLQIKKPNHSILLRSNKNVLEFRPNASLHWGVKYSTDYFYFEYGGKIKDTNYGNSDVGNNSYKSFRIGLPIKNFFIRLYYQEWIGFSSDERDESSCEYCLERERLTSRESSINLTYALNSDFDMRALNSDGSRGVKPSSSWLFLGFYDRFRVHDSGGLIQEDSQNKFTFFSTLQTIEAQQFGVGLGYAFLYPFSTFYLGLSGNLGVGYQENRLDEMINNREVKKAALSHWSLKVNLGTQGDGLNVGLKGYLFSNVYKVGDSQNVANLNYSIYSYMSYSY